MTEKIRTPWTPEQVAALNAFQQCGGMHPFTCGHDHPAHPDAVLEATPKGWRCFVLGCEYEQDWAHAFMANPDAWPKSPFGERHGPTPGEIHRFTARTVTPEEERAATERARQAAEDSVKSAAWFAANSSPHPAEATLARITALADQHPVAIDTALILEALEEPATAKNPAGETATQATGDPA